MDIAAGSWSRIRLYIFLRIYLYTGEFQHDFASDGSNFSVSKKFFDQQTYDPTDPLQHIQEAGNVTWWSITDQLSRTVVRGTSCPFYRILGVKNGWSVHDATFSED